MSKDNRIEHSDSFGNYLIHGIDEIILPADISWWPSTIGWKIVALLLCIFASYRLFKFGQSWWKNRYRREAIAQINELQLSELKLSTQQQASDSGLLTVIEKLPFYLKTTALQAYPRDQVAQLSGTAWIDFLNEKTGSEHFNSNVSEQLLIISYRPKEQWQLTEEQCLNLINLTKLWVKYHV